MLFAKAVYAGGRPFGLYDQPDMRLAFEAYAKLLGINYHPPGRRKLSELATIQQCITKVHDQVQPPIDNESHLGITIDESGDANKRRILNCMVVIGGRSFHWRNEDMGHQTLNAGIPSYHT